MFNLKGIFLSLILIAIAFNSTAEINELNRFGCGISRKAYIQTWRKPTRIKPVCASMLKVVVQPERDVMRDKGVVPYKKALTLIIKQGPGIYREGLESYI